MSVTAEKARRNTYGSYQSLQWGTFVLHRSYKKITPGLWGVPRELICMAKIRYFRATGVIFPRLALL
jgi:hypothetical protein